MSSLFYFDYYGNKRTEIKNIFPYLTHEMILNIDTIVEPFCGSCAFSLDMFCKKGYSDIDYNVNDIDDQLIDFLNVVKKDGFRPFYDYAKKYDYDRTDQEIRMEAKTEYKNNKNAFTFFMKEKTKQRLYISKKMNSFTNEYNYVKFDKTDAFFNKANITCCDYKTIFEQYMDNDKSLLFIDPPYFDSKNLQYSCMRNKDINNGDMTDNTRFYVDILEILKNGKCKIICILNNNKLMKFLYGDYIKSIYDKTYQMTKKKTTHMIITNF